MCAISFVKNLASRTRYAGTEGEREAYNLISKEFESLGCEVIKEETEYIKSEKPMIAYLLLPPWIFLVIIGVSWFVHPLTLALVIVALLVLMVKAPKLVLQLAKDKSINVVATMNPEKKDRLILCGHYDSSRVYSKFAQKYFKALVGVGPLFELASLIYVIILLGRGVYLLAAIWPNVASLLELNPRMTGDWNLVWWGYIILFTPKTLLDTYSLIPYFRAKFSYGADDNASGIAVMIETARRLQGRRLNLRIDFACFAAEEKGLYGSRKWVNKHLGELDRDRTYVLNIDCVGRGETFFVYKGLGTIFKKYSDPKLCGLLAEACSELKLPLEERWGGGSDHAEFLEKKFRTCAIARYNPAKAGRTRLILRRIFGVPLKKNIIGIGEWIHTENDTIEGISEKKLEESVQLVVKFIEKMDLKVELQK